MIDPNLIDKKNWDEHYIKRGNPSKPTYYIIRRRANAVGLFSHFITVAGHIRRAFLNGWIPVVDMQNYSNPYLAPEKLGKENSWEYYFEQPLRIGLEEAYNSENVVLSSGVPVARPQWRGMNIYDNKNVGLAHWRALVKFGILRVKESLHQEILEERKKLFAPNDRVLGVLLRGTDYVALKPNNHPIPPSPEFVIDFIVKKIRLWKCNKIFLATEDKSIVQHFKDTFGDGFGDFCKILNREYVDYTESATGVSVIRIDRENDHFLQGKDYLTQIVILSTCKSFVTARCSGAAGVMLLGENFENTFAFDLGVYGVRPVDWKKLLG